MSEHSCIHIISDSTGETISAALRATTPMFGGVSIRYRRHVMIRNARTLDVALNAVEREPGLVFHTVVESDLRTQLERRCHEIGVTAVPFLDPMISILTSFLGRKAELTRPGAQHAVDERYYQRVAALDFALAYDDGNLAERLAEADVVLIGVSRTSKTPTCVYLAGRGIKAANVPLIGGKPPPDALWDLPGKGTPIVGLTAKPTRLTQIRQNRLNRFGEPDLSEGDYADLESIKREVIEARKIMDALGCAVIDVTRRSVEETAAEIMRGLETGGQERLK